ncbi:nucleolar protein 4 isoform X2 [Phthorimaea operculella]|nr:nucleolar protein 4 isoform X2 [Phthorimaea operculella]
MAAKRKAGALLQHVLPKDNLTPDPGDMTDDDNFSSQGYAKDAEKLKMMLLAWNYHSQAQGGRNGDVTDAGTDSMADLWASYHSALGLGSKPPKAPTPMNTGHSSPIHVGSITPGVEPASTHDETSSSDRTKDDDDAGASDDDSDDRVDPQHHDPERLKAFNMFVRLFVDENLDRIVPISKQPKEKIQAIIDSCTRQFPEFAERARKRIRTYLKSCRRNKKVRGDGPATGNGSAAGAGNAWDTAVRPTPAHLTSVQAEHILAQACENESLNAKRMRLGLDPVSQPMPSVPTPMAIDTSATSAVASSFLSLYSGTISSPASTPATNTSTTSTLAAAGHSKVAADTTRPSASPTLENSLLNNNNLKLDNANGNTGSKTASPASSPAPLFRPTFPSTFGTPQTFGRQSTSTNPATALSSSALLSTLSALPPTGVNAAMAAYQSALLSAMAAQTHTFPNSLAAPTDLSLKNPPTSSSLHGTSTVSSLAGTTPASQAKTPLLSHKLSGADVGAVRQLITGYRESAAFLLRSADELEALLINQP